MRIRDRGVDFLLFFGTDGRMHAVESEADITILPGWQIADRHTQARMVVVETRRVDEQII
jgi:hypothetical protein